MKHTILYFPEILKQHLLPNVICSAVTQNRAITKNVLNKYVTLSRQSGKLTVNGAEVIHSDVMGTNGVMHVIDEVLIPDDGGSRPLLSMKLLLT